MDNPLHCVGDTMCTAQIETRCRLVIRRMARSEEGNCKMHSCECGATSIEWDKGRDCLEEFEDMAVCEFAL